MLEDTDKFGNSDWNVLGDGIGMVDLRDWMGDDLTTVNAARVSMGKESDFQGDGSLSTRDDKLIQYLAKHNHWTPFAHIQVTLRLKMPLFIARQWFKHTVGFTRNEISRRYVDDVPEIYAPDVLRLRADNVKQGSSSETITTDVWNQDHLRTSHDLYDMNIRDGVAPELARMYLPQATYTEFYETASLAAYARLVRQRIDPHAQVEIQNYAEAVDRICHSIAPRSWAALMEGSR